MKVAVWGAGKMGWVHGKAYQKLKGQVEIAWVIEQDAAKAEMFSREFQCKAVPALRMLEPGSVDAIDICLPTYLHKDAVKQASELCRFLFCEKPVCLTKEEYEELKETVKGCHLMIGQVLRFWNGYVKARELVLQGRIGIPRFMTCSRRQKLPLWSKENWLIDNQKSGGLLMDLCIHDIDYMYWLLGIPESVSCQIVKSGGTTLHSSLHMAYEGCCVNVVGSWGMPEGFHTGELETMLEIVGDLGMVIYRGGNLLELVRDSKRQEIMLEPDDGYEQELRYFTECVCSRTDPERCGLTSVEGTMKILWAAQQAADSGLVVKISS